MDNPAALEELNKQLMIQVHHEVGHALESPNNINRGIGEAMRHIGSLLEMGSASYLPVRPDEILVQPVQMRPDSTEAVLLLRRTITSDNAFMVLSSCKTVEDKRAFDLVAYKPDNFDLNKTKFLKVPDEVGHEIIRQLNSLLTNDGSVLLQVVVAKDYFKIEEKPADDGLFNSDVQAPAAPAEPAPVAPPVTGGLPPVTNDHLL